MPSYCGVCGEMMKGGACKCGSASAVPQKADTFEADGLSPVHSQYTDAYVSSGLLKNLDDGLRRMADVRPEWVDKDCCKCGKACTDGALEGPDGIGKGQPFCKSCFSKTYSKGDCAACHNPVYTFNSQQWVNQDGKVFHNECFNEERRCYVCRQPIFGNGVNALGRDYHQKCFQCGNCQSVFSGGSFLEYHGTPYCSKCYDTVKKTGPKVITKSVQQSAPPSDLNAKVMERRGEIEDLKKFQHVAIGDKCSFCHKDILANALTMKAGVIFHPECFKCVACGKGFPDMSFAEKDNLPYHSECLNAANAEKCAGCNQPIVKGKQLAYEGKKFHSDCFKCGGCGKGLVGIPFGESNGTPLCEGCLASPPKVVYGEHRAGFTVNPTSFQKEQRGTGGAKIGAKPAGLGGGDGCPGCGKAVYMSEKTQGPMGTNWHRACLKCSTCSKPLDSMAQMKNDNAYCRDCVKKA